MAAPWRKRRKFFNKQDHEEFTAKYPDIVIFIVNARIQRLRLEQLRRLARKKGFIISSELNDSVTHVVTEIESRDHLVSILQRITRSQRKSDFNVLDFAQKKELLSIKWFTACMEEGKPVEIIDEHRLPERKPVDPDAEDDFVGDEKPRNRKFACQRITPTNHPNKKFTVALEMMERAAELRMDDTSRSRALAFRKASAALKALPAEIKCEQDIENLYDIKGGSHCRRVILDILEHGYSSEVDRIMQSNWYTGMSLFTGVFGVGLSTAARWCQMGLKTLGHVQRSYMLNLTKSQLKGIEYYYELNSPVTKPEAEWIHKEVADALKVIDPRATVQVTGGFRRGKDSGHDVDLLISHPEEGQEKGLLAALLQSLNKKDYLEYTDIQNSGYVGGGAATLQGADSKKSTMDHFERCFSIFRLPKSQAHPVGLQEVTPSTCRAPVRPTPAPPTKTQEASEGGGGEAIAPSSTNGFTQSSGSQSSVTAGQRSRKRRAPVDFTADDLGDDFDDGGLEEDEGDDGGDDGADVSGDGAAPDTPYIPEDTLSQPSVDTSRSWVAKRVDFVIAPTSQYAFAILGWTGSKMFNRSMRDYANKVMNMNLSSHGLFDKTKNCSLPAKSEEEIFELLKLEYRKHDERSC